MKIRIVKNCKYKKSWMSKFGCIIRNGFKRGVLCPLCYECDTLEDLESYYNSVKTSSDIQDMHIARYFEDIYNYGEYYFLKEDVDIEDLNRIFRKEV